MIRMIVATDLGRAIGREGDLLFYIGADLRRFKALTMGNTVIMGRKTFDSLPKGALPHRHNIVVSRNPQWTAPEAETATTVEEALEMAADNPGDVFFIGGASIYAAALPLVQQLDLTVVHTRAPMADTFFPAVSLDDFRVTAVETVPGEPAVSFISLTRKHT